MQCGVIYDFRNPQRWRVPFPRLYAETLDQISAVEELGFHSVWLTEHHFIEDGYLPSLLPMAAAVAARTRRVRIGTWVLLLPLHHALRVAEDAAVVDILSNGRFDLGVGLGYRLGEFEAFGIERRHRPSLLEEGVEVIRRAWTEERFSFTGRRYRLKDVSLQPKPVQRPHPPLWIGGRASASVRRAARLGCPLLLVAGKAEYEEYVAALKELGRDPKLYPVLVSCPFYVAEDPERAWAEIAEHALHRAQLYGDWYGEAADLSRDAQIRVADPKAFLRQRPRTVCTPEEARAQIEADRQQVPYSHLILWGTYPGLSPARSLRSLDLFARKVLPHFRD